MIKRYCTLILCFSFITAIGQNNISIEPADCFLKNCEPSEAFNHVTFGYLQVPENYDVPDGRSIKVAYSVIKSRAADRKPDPILLFAGGWGVPQLESTYGFAKNFPFKDRDLILYDYRGTGYSQPALCPELGAAHWELLEQDLDMEAFFTQVNAQLEGCFEGLNQQHIDYRLYGTAIKARDAVHLMEQLGYEEVNVFGVSNGTMAIQGFLRAAEGSSVTVRSIMSDSNVPMHHYISGRQSLVYKAVLDKLLDDCANNPECDAAYPNLKQRFYNFLKESQDKPLVYDGRTSFVFNTYEINGVVHQLMYNHKNHKDIPLVLEAFINKDLKFFDPLHGFFKNQVKSLNGTSAINYTYDWNYGKAGITADYENVKRDYSEFMFTDFWLDFYAKDSLIGYHAMDTIPVRSTVPSLILAGSYDPITPPGSSVLMQERYTNSFYFELPRVGHGAIFSACGEALYRSFLANPLSKPDGQCVESLHSKPIPFTTSLYANPKVGTLFVELVQKNNVLWLLLCLLPLVLSLAFLVRALVIAFKRRRPTPLLFSLQALSILMFLGALLYYGYTTANLQGLTLIFGLVGAAVWLPWFSLMLLIVGLLCILALRKVSYPGFWNYSLVLATLCIWVLIFNFGVYPQ